MSDEKITLGTLARTPGSHRNRKRLGRGPGSGTGKTSGKGHKGIKARAGHHGPEEYVEIDSLPRYRRALVDFARIVAGLPVRRAEAETL